MTPWEQYDQMRLTGTGSEEQRAAIVEKLTSLPADRRKFSGDAAGLEMKLVRRLAKREDVDLLLESEQLQQRSAPTALLWKWAAFMNGTPSEDALRQLEQELEKAGNDPLNRLMQQACREQREAIHAARQQRSSELDSAVDDAQRASDKATADRKAFERGGRY